MTEAITQLIERQIHRWSRVDAVLKKGREGGAGPKRHLPVITISRQSGSGGRVVAKALSEQLGMDLFGYSIVDAIAQSAHLERKIVDSLDETVHSDIENYIAGLLRGRILSNHEYSRRLARVLTTIARHGLAIILGRGGAYVLREQADLHVRFHAPLEFRVHNMVEYDKLDEDVARVRILEADKRRAEFVQRLFHVDINDSTWYDLSVDTSRIALKDCIELCAEALRRRLPPESRAALHGGAG